MTRFQTLLFCLSMIAVLGLSACNTVAGIGEDASAAGHAIEHAAGH